MVIKGFHVGRLLKEVGKAIWADNILTIAAAVAYNFFFSIFPLLLFAAPLLGLVGNKQQLFGWILNQLAGSVPPAAYTMSPGLRVTSSLRRMRPGSCRSALCSRRTRRRTSLAR